MKKVKDKSYALRIDARLVEPLQKLKKKNRRSLNAEINAAIETWVARPARPAAAKSAAKAAPAAGSEPALPAAAASRPAKVAAKKARGTSATSKPAAAKPVGQVATKSVASQVAKPR